MLSKINQLKLLGIYQQPDILALSKTMFSTMDQLQIKLTHKTLDLNVDLLWHCAGIFKRAARQGPRPNWSSPK